MNGLIISSDNEAHIRTATHQHLGTAISAAPHQLGIYGIFLNAGKCCRGNAMFSWIVARMKPQIVDFIHDKPINQRKIIDIVNFIRNNPEELPEWHNSDTAKLFSLPKFENKKENKGYWF